MFVLWLTLIHAVSCFELQVEGDVALDVRVEGENLAVLGGRPGQQWFRQSAADPVADDDHLVFRMMRVQRSNVTAAPVVECVYQYPEKKQVDSMLSHMMNELTKVFVRANEFIANPFAVRRRMSESRAQRHRSQQYESEEKRNDKRFHIVYEKHKQFFERIYTNMTNEYSTFYNNTAERVERTDRDPCQHQEEIKQIWHDLLEHSLKTLKRATQRCVDAYLEDQNIEPNSRVGHRLRRFLTKELRKIRSNQLNMLCDVYQLCYNDLLK